MIWSETVGSFRGIVPPVCRSLHFAGTEGISPVLRAFALGVGSIWNALVVGAGRVPQLPAARVLARVR
jgi:hypothetical protein